MYKHMNTLTDVWNNEGKWANFKLMKESAYNVASQMKEENDKQKTDTRDRKKELDGKTNQILSLGVE